MAALQPANISGQLTANNRKRMSWRESISVAAMAKLVAEIENGEKLATIAQLIVALNKARNIESIRRKSAGESQPA